jgi:ankyrin repeat protein/tetratricopeptide (TPR) repeat protein
VSSSSPIPANIRDADLSSNIMYLAREPQQPLEDLREEIEALRERTIELEMQGPVLSKSLDNSQLLALARDTVADGETVYAQSVASGSVFGDGVEKSSGQKASLSAWLHQQAFEASQRSLGPVMEDESLIIAPPGSDDARSSDADQSQLDHDHTSKNLGDIDGELDFEHNIINSLIELARVSFEAENYQDAKMKLQATIANIRDLPSDARSIYDFFELQYKLAVAMFYTTERKNAQTFLLDFARQQTSTDKQRHHIAHASQLLAETYISTGNLAAARSSCSNAIRIHQRLGGEDPGSQDNCFALAARIEILLHNQDKAEAYAHNISPASKTACMERYATTTPEKSLSIKKRRALFSAEKELFKNFRFDEASGTVHPLPVTETKGLFSSRSSTGKAVDFERRRVSRRLLMSLRGSSRPITPLHIAAMFGEVDNALNWIENGADVNLKGPCLYKFHSVTMTPLACAILSRHEDMVRMLVSRGARLSLSRKDGTVYRSPVIALAHEWPVLQDSASEEHGMLACLKYLGWDINSPVNLKGDSMLHIAAESGAIELAQALMAYGLKPSTTNADGETPLHTAYGASSDADDFIDLASALLQGEPSAVLDCRDKNGLTVLHCAISEDEVSIDKVQYLLERGSDVVAKDKAGNIPLTFAILEGVEALGLRTLLNFHKDDQLESQNLELQTPLQVALAESSPDVVVELLRSGASPFVVDATGETALEVILGLYKPEDFTLRRRQAWREVWGALKAWPDAREAVDQLEKRDRDFDKELLHPRTTKFLKSPIWSLGKSKNK